MKPTNFQLKNVHIPSWEQIAKAALARLEKMEQAADALRDSFVPNNEEHPAVVLYNEAKSMEWLKPSDQT